MILIGQERRIDDLTVLRVLPASTRRLVGPFIFFDHFGPTAFPAGNGIDVRPHPHINLATVTYLFEGELTHRDSLGTDQRIGPGAINWMTAGRGIVHSERTPPHLRDAGSSAHGLQIWIALPKENEEVAPEVHHHAASTLPRLERPGAALTVLAGSAYERTSPVRTFSPLFYVEATLAEGAELAPPSEYADRAAYVVDGAVSAADEHASRGQMLVFPAGGDVTLRAERPSHVVLIGGAPLDGPRHIWWNFVSSSKPRIEQAKSDWRDGRFPKVPGDEVEFIPLPDGA